MTTRKTRGNFRQTHHFNSENLTHYVGTFHQTKNITFFLNKFEATTKIVTTATDIKSTAHFLQNTTQNSQRNVLKPHEKIITHSNLE